MIWPPILLFFLALSTSSQASLYDPAVFAELARYRHCVKILHETLLAEKCTNPSTHGPLVRREVLSKENQNLLVVEKKFLEQLNVMLISCRNRKQTAIAQPAMEDATKPTTSQTTTLLQCMIQAQFCQSA